MGRQIVGVVVGLKYVAASGDLSFTLPMKLTRLSIGALTTIAAGAVTALVGRSRWTAVVTGGLLLLIFIPEHISLWDKFPIWYHLTFLTSLVPLAAGGGAISARPDQRA
jgi:hypothetical protein